MGTEVVVAVVAAADFVAVGVAVVLVNNCDVDALCIPPVGVVVLLIPVVVVLLLDSNKAP